MNSTNSKISTGNIGYYFYRKNKLELIKEINDIQWTDDLDKKSLKDLFGSDKLPTEILELPENNNILSFKLRTLFPGLIIGAGYNHEAIKKAEKDTKGDYQLGFYFDHTSGLPVIPGSTIKGVLKSVFPNMKDIDEIFDNKLNYIYTKLSQNPSSQLKEIIEKKEQKIDKINLLYYIFFERKQVFFDAIPVDIDFNFYDGNYLNSNSNNIKYNQKRLFGDDYITPHKDIFKNPVPIRFLKVMPGVTYCFRFMLFDYEKNGCIVCKSKILDLFKYIIVDFGIGAKRNVGFGSFTLL